MSAYRPLSVERGKMPLLTQPVVLKKSIPHRELQYHRGQDCFGLLTLMTGAASAPPQRGRIELLLELIEQ
jgi:hypothetical protein